MKILSTASPESTLTMPVVLALASVYFFWGTTYLAMKIAVETLPSYLMLGTRFGIAGGIMFLILLLCKVEKPTPRQWKSAFLAGGMMLCLSTGSVSLAGKVMPSNISATVLASTPLWMAFFQWAFFKGGRPSFWTSVGLVIGFIGVTILVTGSGKQGSGNVYGYLLLIFSSGMWALGSLVSRVIDIPKSPLMAVSMQMIGGALFCLIVGFATGEHHAVDLAKMSLRSVLAMLYLVIFGSFIGYGSYIWLMRNISPTLASTYAYVNPVVAIFMGWLIMGETLTTQEISGAVVILLAVIAIIKANAKKR